MGLAQVQQVLAQLYTNKVLRERFFAEPQAVGETLGLSVEEAMQLAQLSPQQVKLFASSLKHKRLGEVRELLPLTQQVLGKQFFQLFWQYAETYLPQGIKKHFLDAIAFATFIEQIATKEEIEPAWVVEVVRYEKAWVQATQLSSNFTICLFRYEINQLVRSLKQQDQEPVLLLRPSLAIWFRFSPKDHLRQILL